jgi:hypothetical protein
MVRLIKGVLIFLMVAGVFYLAFVVNSGQVDFRNWDTIDRAHYAFYGIILGFIISVFYVIIDKIK